MYTVCGHPQPHQTRPANAVANTIVTKTAQHGQGQQQGVGRQESMTQKDETARPNIQQHGRQPSESQMGKHDKKNDQRVTERAPAFPPATRATNVAESSDATRHLVMC